MKTINYFICISLYLLIASCYTLNSHQTGKTVGRNNQSYQLIYGLAGVPEFKDENNWDAAGLMLPQALVITGITDNFDIGATVGLNKFGLFTKYQFIGNQESKEAVAVGLNVFAGLNEITWSDYKFFSSLELPIYISYELLDDLTVYASSSASYIQGPQKVILKVPDRPGVLDYNFYSGLILGFKFDFPDRFFVTIESAWSSPFINQEYVFYTTTSVGFKIIARGK